MTPARQETDIDSIKAEIYRTFRIGTAGVAYCDQLRLLQRYFDENKGNEKKCRAAREVLTEVVAVNIRATMPLWRPLM